MRTRCTGRFGARRVLALLVVAACLTAWWTWLRPTSLGGSTTLVTVTGTSMQPGMHTGDLALVRDTGDYGIGDVIAYRVRQPDGSPGSVVIHRIVGGDPRTGWFLQGDNNDFVDPWRPVAGDVVGELWWHVPEMGRAIAKLREPLTGAALLAALTAFAVVAGAQRSRREDRAEPALTGAGGTE